MADAQILQQMTPASRGAAVTPSNTANLTATSRGIYVGVSGDVVVTLQGMIDGTSLTFTGLAAGVVHPLKVKRVWTTGTTATNIVAVY